MVVIDSETLEILSTLPASTIYESAGKLGDMAPSIRPLVHGARLFGQAFTVKCVPGDNLVVIRAVDEAPRGSVLVIDAGGTERSTIWGGTSTLAAKRRQLAGCVTNGAARDVAEIRELGFPVFAAGVSVRGTVKSHPGWIGIPISVGGAIVNPGDVVVGDEDGVVVVAAQRAREVAKLALIRKEREEEHHARIKAGEPLSKILGILANKRAQ